MVALLKSRRYYFFSFLVLWSIGWMLFLYQEHGHWVLFLDERHSPALDFFFAYWTHTGSTLFFVIVASLHVLIKVRKGLVLAMIGISVLVVSKFLKQVVFADTPRPVKFFEGTETLQIVDGSIHVLDHAFPSGHSMAAFALATFFVFSSRNKWAPPLLLSGAYLCGVSRIYLGQHFLIDVLAGSMLGLLLSVFFVGIFHRRFSAKGLS